MSTPRPVFVEMTQMNGKQGLSATHPGTVFGQNVMISGRRDHGSVAHQQYLTIKTKSGYGLGAVRRKCPTITNSQTLQSGAFL